MRYIADLTLRYYKPKQITPGMYFVNHIHINTIKETIEVFELDKFPYNEEEFIAQTGYPVEFYIIGEDDQVLAEPHEIGWWDAGDDTDELYDVTLKEVNIILQDFRGMIGIDMEEIHTDDESDDYIEAFPVKYMDKVTLSYPIEEQYVTEEEEDDDDEWDEDDMDDDTWKTE